MYNYQTSYYNFLQVVEHEWGPIKTSHGAGKVVVTANEKRYLCIFEDGEPEPIIKRIHGLVGRLKFVKYLQYHDLIFVASDFEFLTMKRRDGEHDRYSETDLDIRAVEWNPTETGFVACTGKNEVLYFTFKRTSLSLQSRCSLGM
nr:unnamed protein product [Callosobruchus chinensis]